MSVCRIDSVFDAVELERDVPEDRVWLSGVHPELWLFCLRLDIVYCCCIFFFFVHAERKVSGERKHLHGAGLGSW